MRNLVTRRLVYPLYELVTGRQILQKLSWLEESQWWTEREIATWQEDQLSCLLEHAYETVPYYRRMFDTSDVAPDRVGLVGLAQLPLLHKSTIQEHRDELVSTAYPEHELISNHTGGSTGTPMHFWQDQRQRDWGSASKLRFNSWAGWDFGKRVLRLWGHPQDLEAAQSLKGKIRSVLLNEHTFDAFGFSSDDMVDLVRYIRTRKPHIILAYASMLAHFATYADEQGITHLPIPDGIITSTDMLLPHQRTLIERVFRAPVFNRYGCREVSVIAAECDRHSGIHINADRLIVEFVDQNGQPVPPGEPGQVVITDLYNYAMPLIRYSIGDVAVPSAETCPCGRELPLIDELAGRHADILSTPTGQFVSASALTTILPKIDGLRECQLIQRNADWLQVLVVRYPRYDDASERSFREELAKFFGPQMSITFRYVDTIPTTTSGKRRFSISEVQNLPL